MRPRFKYTTAEMWTLSIAMVAIGFVAGGGL